MVEDSTNHNSVKSRGAVVVNVAALFLPGAVGIGGIVGVTIFVNFLNCGHGYEPIKWTQIK